MTTATPIDTTCEQADSRLEHIPGVPAELFVDPSQEHWFWVRKFRWLFAPAPGKANKFARWYARSTVVPLTNVTNLSLQYQSYLNDIFHTTKFARIGHALAMPGIVVCLSALFRMLGGDWFALPFHVGLTLWWLLWAVIERDAVWGIALALFSVAVWFAGSAMLAYGISPWVTLLVLAAIQAGSHLPEPVPPRVNRATVWVPVMEYVFSGPWTQNVRRIGHCLQAFFFGVIDETLASPRLVCVIILELLWTCGHRPAQRSAWKTLSRKAIQSGNPALDYIGVGGGTTLRTGDKR